MIRRLGLGLLTVLGLLTPAWGEPSAPAEKITGPLSWHRCVELGLDHNAEVLLASTRFIDASGQAIQLRTELYPQIGIGALTFPPTVFVHLDQVVYDRALGPKLRLSRLTGQQAEQNYRVVLVSVVWQLRQAFVQALAKQETMTILQDYAEQNHRLAQSAQGLFDGGKIDDAQRLRLKVRWKNSEQQALQARSDWEQAMRGLESLVGVAFGKEVLLQGKLISEFPNRLDVKALTEQALSERDDLRLLESLKLSAQEQVLISSRSVYPSVSVGSQSTFNLPFPISNNYDINRNFGEAGAQRNASNSQVPLSVYVSWTFFDGGRARGLVQSSQAQLASQSEALRALRESIPGNIAAAVAGVEGARKAEEISEHSPTPEELRKSAELDFEAARLSLLEKNLLEDDILATEQNRIAIGLQLSLANAALDAALGHVVQFSTQSP